ncbi:MAG: hypothetical protein CPDRYMAC_5092 [uncultured Paraburkholderia sp.]|nr:MAG: hypothetical protein CPDRYDRY_4930 [uncultured Paraburkholderia sp.]CAH2939380.1 MAG: hypothetical protein CPDRYMAC_5092 [uncultured Paraburkholderia sp.]
MEIMSRGEPGARVAHRQASVCQLNRCKEVVMSQHPAHAQNHRHPDEARTQDIVRALKGAQYPASKEQLIALAKHNGADGEVMAVLQRMNEHNFDSDSAVVREATRVE